MRVAAADLGHRGQELLVEVVAEADRGGADALVIDGAARERDQRGRVGDADVRQAVGQQQDLADRAALVGAAQDLEALHPAARQVGLTTGAIESIAAASADVGFASGATSWTSSS